jgi:hypothetical protein
LGVVVGFSPPPAGAEEVFAELELLEVELLEDPQPAASISAPHAINAGRPLFIGS